MKVGDTFYFDNEIWEVTMVLKDARGIYYRIRNRRGGTRVIGKEGQ